MGAIKAGCLYYFGYPITPQNEVPEYMSRVLPGLLFARRLRGLGVLLVVAAAYFVMWFMLRQNVRFLFPIVPLAAVALVWVWMEMSRLSKRPRAIVTMAVWSLIS